MKSNFILERINEIMLTGSDEMFLKAVNTLLASGYTIQSFTKDVPEDEPKPF